MGQLDTAYREHRGGLRRFIRSKIADRETAEDILQDVYARAAASVADSVAEPIENMAAWLFRAASNRIVDWYRRRFRTEASLEDESSSMEGLLVTSEIDLHDELVRDLVLDELSRAIDELPRAQREVIRRQAIGGETFGEISEDSGVSINTLLARKRYAMAALRKRLHGIEDTFNELMS